MPVSEGNRPRPAAPALGDRGFVRSRSTVRFGAGGVSVVFRAILVAVSEEKPRIFQGSRDIFLSLAVIIVVMIVSVGFTGMCSYGRDTTDQPVVNEVDAAAFFSLEARAMDFPVRLPQVPAGWVANSARRGAVAGEPAPIVGWVIAEDGYVQLTQTNKSVDEAITGVDSHVRERAATYTIPAADDIDVQVYSSTDDDVRDIRVVDLGDVRLVVSGAATQEQFDDLIRRTVAAAPINSGR